MKDTSLLGQIDQRLSARRAIFLSRIVERRTCIIRQLSAGWQEEMSMWRFLKNARFDWTLLRADSLSGISTQVSGLHVLSVEDSSTVSLQGYVRKRQGFGRMGSTGNHPGFVIHPSLVLNASNGHCLGLADVQMHDGQQAFSESSQYSGKQRRQRPSMETKTGVWLSSGKAARARLHTAARVTHVADREADFFEMLLEFGQKKFKNEDFIIRSSRDRQLGHRGAVGHSPYQGRAGIGIHTGSAHRPIWVKHRSLMSELVEKLPVQGIIEVNLPPTHKRRARTAILEVRFAQNIPICRPRKICRRLYEGEVLPGSVQTALVEAREITPDLPPGEVPVCWQLYTSHTVDTLKDALQIIKWYTWRWKIELLFAVTKSCGLNLEHALINHAPRLKKLAILVLMAAVQVIQLLQARDGLTGQLITEMFDDEEVRLLQQIKSKVEGKTDLLKNPHPDHALASATWIMARLGGWKGYQTHRPPGIKTISRGLRIFYQIKSAAQFLSG